MKQLVNPTRRKIIALLRGGERTVSEMVKEVGLTDNAIRSHLEALERQGLVRRSGMRPGSRKPHNTYLLTQEARKIFFEACEPLLNELFAALSSRLTEQKFRDVLVDAGRRMAAANSLPLPDRRTKKERIDHAITVLTKLGGSPTVQKEDGTLIIQSPSCPWAVVTAKHAEVCQIAEELVSQLIGAPVTPGTNPRIPTTRKTAPNANAIFFNIKSSSSPSSHITIKSKNLNTITSRRAARLNHRFSPDHVLRQKLFNDQTS